MLEVLHEEDELNQSMETLGSGEPERDTEKAKVQQTGKSEKGQEPKIQDGEDDSKFETIYLETVTQDAGDRREVGSGSENEDGSVNERYYTLLEEGQWDDSKRLLEGDQSTEKGSLGEVEGPYTSTPNGNLKFKPQSDDNVAEEKPGEDVVSPIKLAGDGEVGEEDDWNKNLNSHGETYTLEEGQQVENLDSSKLVNEAETEDEGNSDVAPQNIPDRGATSGTVIESSNGLKMEPEHHAKLSEDEDKPKAEDTVNTVTTTVMLANPRKRFKVLNANEIPNVGLVSSLRSLWEAKLHPDENRQHLGAPTPFEFAASPSSVFDFGTSSVLFDLPSSTRFDFGASSTRCNLGPSSTRFDFGPSSTRFDLGPAPSVFKFGASNTQIVSEKQDYDHKSYDIPVPVSLEIKSKTETESVSDTDEDQYEDDIDSTEDLSKLMPEPGYYKVTIELTKFWLKKCNRVPEEDTFNLRYTHFPMGINEPVDCYASRLEDDDNDSYQAYQLMNKKGFASFSFQLHDFTNDMLNNPLTVEFRKFSKVVSGSNKCFATAMIPFGRVFSKEPSHDCTQLRVFFDTVDILKRSNKKIGTLVFEIHLMREENTSYGSNSFEKKPKSAFFLPHVVEHEKDLCTKYYDDRGETETESMRKWIQSQEENRKKEQLEIQSAHLKFLSDEYAKRSAERESMISKKMSELDLKEKALHRLKQELNLKEERLENLKLEVNGKSWQLDLEQENIMKNAELSRRRFEADLRNELNLLQQRVAEYKHKNQSLKTKVATLKKQLQDVDQDRELELEREELFLQLTKRVSTLEHNNILLRQLLNESETKKCHYKELILATCEPKSSRRDADFVGGTEKNSRLKMAEPRVRKASRKINEAEYGMFQAKNALRSENLKEIKRNKSESDSIIISLNKSPDAGASKDKALRNEELRRLQLEKKVLMGTGGIVQYSAAINQIDKKIARLSQE